MYFNVLSANIRKVIIEMVRYLPNTLSTIATFYAIFLMLFWGIRAFGDPLTQAENIESTIVGVVLWSLAIMVMQGMGWEITSEATRGTLEQLYMSPVAAWRILVARTLGRILTQLVIMVVVLLLAMLTAGQWLQVDVLLVPLFVLLLTCMMGVSLMIAGLAIVLKQIDAFLQIVQFAFFGLVSVPVTVSPWLELLPIVRASSMIHDVMAEGSSWAEVSPTMWALLVANALIYFGLGITLYKRAEQRALRLGLLGQY
ncbi:MAG: ABC transporter permease [Deinococcota bacterium]